VGDEVYGDNLALKGGFAEFAVAPESVLAPKPKELTFAEASTIPQAGAIALQGTAPAGAGRRILINGAGGGTGSFAIQLAKRAGAHVTGVDNAAKLDLVATRSPLACGRALARGGRYRCVGGSVPVLLGVATAGSIAGRLTGRRLGVLVVRAGPAQFGPLADLCVAGEVAVHIDRTFALDDVPEALRRVGEGHALGKVVVEPQRR
jgi:NADPH:quinone reductase-like Zn-dependent oxidoreductase